MKKFLVVLFLLVYSPLIVLADDVITSGNTGTPNIEFGNTSNNRQAAQGFTTIGAGTISSITVRLIKEGSPVDNVVVGLYANAVLLPIGAFLDSGSKVGSSLTGSCVAYTFTFSGPVSVTGATKYWVGFSRDGSLHDTNLYATCGTGSNYDGLGYGLYNGTAWNTLQTGSADFTLTVVTSGGGSSQPFSRFVAYWW